MCTAQRINVCRLSLSRNGSKETSLIMLLEMRFSPNNRHLVFFSGKRIKTGKEWHEPKNVLWHYSATPFFKRSHFIRVPIPSAPNKWTAISDTKLIARLAMGCHAGQALLSQWKCNLCGANEEELPCDDSYTQHWKEHVALKSAATFWQITSLRLQHNAFYALRNQVSSLIFHAT